MVTITVLLAIDIPESHSLKEKRAVVRSLVERLRRRMQVSAAEVGLQDHVGRAEVGYAVVSGDLATARSLAAAARRFVEAELLGRGEVIDAVTEETVLG
jgi:uncharacterized protein YlxP (DUF503 family)